MNYKQNLISKLTPYQITMLNDNNEPVILNPDEFRQVIKKKRELSNLLSSLKNPRTLKNFELSKEEKYFLKTTKTKEEKARELDEEMEKNTRTIIDINAKNAKGIRNKRIEKKFKEYLESKNLESKKGGRRRTKKNIRSRKNKK